MWNFTFYFLPGEIESTPVVEDGVVYTDAYDGMVYALDASTGASVWNYSTGNDTGLFSSPAFVGGVLYFCSVGGGTIYALNASNGASIWNYQTQGIINCSPAIANGVLYVASWDGNLYALSCIAAPQPAPVPVVSSPSPSPSPSPNPLSVIAQENNGSTVDLTLSGNITSSQMSNVTMTTDELTNVTALSFTLTGQNGTSGFSNITIPISAILSGASPSVYIDGAQPQDQGFTMDSSNYYVWYTTHFSTHQVSIVFSEKITEAPSGSKATLSLPDLIYGVAIGIAIVAIIILLLKATTEVEQTNSNYLSPILGSNELGQ